MSDFERQRDKGRLDRLLDAWDAVLKAESEGGETVSVETLTLASRSVPALLERRSKLLGLDVEAGAGAKQGAGDRPLDRIMAVVPKAGGSTG